MIDRQQRLAALAARRRASSPVLHRFAGAPVAALSSAKGSISRANSDLNFVSSDTKVIVRLLATLSSKRAALRG